MVRVGGGYMTIQEYYDKFSWKQCVRIFHELSNKGTTFLETVTGLLQRHKSATDIVSKYRKAEYTKRWEDTNRAFVLLSTFVEMKVNQQRRDSAAVGKGKKKKVTKGKKSKKNSPVKP